jgi:hypothetical protein
MPVPTNEKTFAQLTKPELTRLAELVGIELPAGKTRPTWAAMFNVNAIRAGGFHHPEFAKIFPPPPESELTPMPPTPPRRSPVGEIRRPLNRPTPDNDEDDDYDDPAMQGGRDDDEDTLVGLDRRHRDGGGRCVGRARRDGSIRPSDSASDAERRRAHVREEEHYRKSLIRSRIPGQRHPLPSGPAPFGSLASAVPSRTARPAPPPALGQRRALSLPAMPRDVMASRSLFACARG